MFLHGSELEAAGIHPVKLRIGQRLTYETGEHNGKTKAVDVRLVWPLPAIGLKSKAE